MPFHRKYADGTPRPFLRGWLHGISACIALPLLITNWSTLPSPAIPGLIAICFTLTLSSLVHLVPWQSTLVLEVLTRLDKTGILAICFGSFFGPQLLTNAHACKPPLVMAIGTVAIPIGLSVLGVACGMGPIVFVGCAIAFFSTTGWYLWHPVQDDDNHAFVLHSGVCIVLYGAGLALYVSQVGGQKTKYWGYHEWMHLLVTLSFIVNARGLLLMSDYNGKMCIYSDGGEDLNMESISKPLFSWLAME